MATPIIGKKNSVKYLDKKEMVFEIVKSKKKQEENPDLLPAECMTPRLVEMMIELVRNYSKHPSFGNYSYRDDMVMAALENLMKHGLKFDPSKYEEPNPFGYYTMITYRCFITFIRGENKERDIKDDLAEEYEQLPSFGRQLNNEIEQSLDNIQIEDEMVSKKKKRKKAKKTN